MLASLVGLIVGFACIALEAAIQAVQHVGLDGLAGFPYQLAVANTPILNPRTCPCHHGG